MRAVVDLDHFFHRDLGVDLGGREAGVAEEFLDVAEVGALIEQVRGECVAQAVRRDVVDVGALLDVFVDHPADAAGGDPRALVIKETGLLVTLRSAGNCSEKQDAFRQDNASAPAGAARQTARSAAFSVCR